MKKIACSSITFGRLKAEQDFAKALEDIKSSGYTGLQIEHRFLPKDLLRNAKRVKRLIDDSGLETVAVAVTLEPYTIRFTEEVDGKVGTLCLFENDYDKALRKAKNIAKLSKNLGVTLAVHPHVQSDIETIQGVEGVLEKCKEYSPKLVFDSAHFTALGWDLSNFIKRFHQYISVVHIKDLRALVSPDKLDLDKDFVDVGDGVVDFKKLLTSLEEAKYDGWLIVEVDSPGGNETASESIAKNYESLSRY